MLNAGVLRFDASGRIRWTTALPLDFNGGTPTNNGLLAGNNAIPTRFVAGLGYVVGDGLAAFNSAPVNWVGGIPLNANGQVCVDATGSAVVASYVSGLPLTADGKLALAAVE
jgi:hypothetical protein